MRSSKLTASVEVRADIIGKSEKIDLAAMSVTMRTDPVGRRSPTPSVESGGPTFISEAEVDTVKEEMEFDIHQ